MNLIDYLPSHMQGLIEFRQIINTEQPEIDALIKAIETAPDDFFLSTLTSYGVKRWEKIFGIVPKPGESLPSRRFRIQTKYMDQLPYTYRTMIRNLSALSSDFKAEIDNNNYLVFIDIVFDTPAQKLTVEETLRNMLPVNMILRIKSNYQQITEYSTVTCVSVPVMMVHHLSVQGG